MSTNAKTKKRRRVASATQFDLNAVEEHLLGPGLLDFNPAEKAARGNWQIVDLFCGCGGLSTGFEHFGRLTKSYRLLASADLNPVAIETFAANLPIRPLARDLGAIARDPKAIRQFIKELNVDTAKPLIVIGGPPCQGFSAHRKKHGPSDDSRNSLVSAFAEIAAHLDPEFIVFENVPEVLSKKHWELFSKMRKQLESHGYKVRAQIHNLAGFGVPQERFRALIVASKAPILLPRPFLPRERFRTVRQAIGPLEPVSPGERNTDPMHFCANHKESTLRVIRAVPKNGGSRPPGVGPRCLNEVDGFRDVYGRMSWDRPANTITANSRNPAGGRYVHPTQNRGLTVREAALLQGFPKGFIFDGSFDDKFLQIGNAVPPVFATYLAACLWRNIIEPIAEIPEGESEEDIVSPLSNSFSSGIAGRKKSSPLAKAA